MKKEMTSWGVGPRFTLFSVLYFILTLVIHIVWYPRFVIPGLPYAVLVTIGLILMAIGIPIWVTASNTVDRAFEENALATHGVYALCRHPIYGNAIFFTIPGILMFFRSWLLLTTPAFMYIVFKLLIGREEDYLQKRFGTAYRKYTRLKGPGRERPVLSVVEGPHAGIRGGGRTRGNPRSYPDGG